MAGLLEACAVAIAAQYATPGGAVTATAGLAVAVALIARWLYCATAELTRNRRVRTRHHEMLALIGRTGPVNDVTVLDHASPVVYCLAGRPHRIVMTSAATRALNEPHLASVLAHERAHLRGRHDLAVAIATATAAAFPFVPVFRHARHEVTRLIELVADDHATRATNRLNLAEAMLTLASAAPPPGALAAKGSTAAARIHRLIDGPRPLRAGTGILGVGAALLLVVAPILALMTPAASAAAGCCGDRPSQATAVSMYCHDDCARDRRR
jgi:beta-lactamase regulating signal transducer with metallopeptidase domain